MRYCLGPPDSFGNMWAALAFMPFGLFFDFMDGKVARWRGKSSLMGQELDSLADLVRDESLLISILPTCTQEGPKLCLHYLLIPPLSLIVDANTPTRYPSV